jgi:thiol-disulfide isomerase/thioredoxin
MKRIHPAIEIGIMISIMLLIYAAGWHTEVIGRMQQVLLKTGLFAPNELSKSAYKTLDKDFELVDLKGNKVSLDELKGKIVFINFWASWCSPCVAEMPDINQLYNDYRGKDIAFLLVNLDADKDKMKKFLERKDFDFATYVPLSLVPNQLKSQSIPATFVLNREGQVVLEHFGMASYDNDDFRFWLDELIEEI